MIAASLRPVRVTPRVGRVWSGSLVAVGPSQQPIACDAAYCVVIPTEPGLAREPLLVRKTRVLVSEADRRVPVGTRGERDVRVRGMA